MKRTEATGSIAGQYIDRNTELGREGTLLTAEDRNAIQEELVGVIEASGQILNGGDLGQLLKAIVLKLGNVAETITGVKTFSDIPILPAVNPTTDNQATRRKFVADLDAQNVKISGAQTISDVKTFTSIPVGPDADPTTDNQLARRKFVVDSVSGVTRDQLGLGAGDSVNFANLNPPVDNTGSVMPNIGIGGFTYGADSGADKTLSVTLPPFGTIMYSGTFSRDSTFLSFTGKGSGGSTIGGYVTGPTGGSLNIVAWRIA